MSHGELGSGLVRQARCGALRCCLFRFGRLWQVRYGYYGSLWCGELQLKVPTLMIYSIRDKR